MPQNDAEALKLFERSAMQGHPVAQFNLGMCFVYGQGVLQSYVNAYVWFSLSATRGDEISKDSRDRAAEALSPGELKVARQLLRAKSAEIGQRRRAKYKLAGDLSDAA